MLLNALLQTSALPGLRHANMSMVIYTPNCLTTFATF